MAKKEKAAKKEKTHAAPKLAAFVDHSFPIYLTMGEKEREARVLTSGMISFKEKEYASPCAAATAMAKDMGEKWTLNAWTALKFNKDGERVALNVVRGAKSPLKVAAPKPKAASKAKAKKEAKPKAAKRAKKVAQQAASAPAGDGMAQTQEAPF